LEGLWQLHSKHRKAFFFHQQSFTHDFLTLVQSIDGEIETFMKEWVNNDTVRNTSLVVIMSDHGCHSHPSQIHVNSLAASLDQKNPFVYVLVPPWVKESHPERIAALGVNARERVTTNVDLYHTFVHLLLKSNESDVRNSRGQTLLNVIPKNRTCEDMGIDQFLCGCRPLVRLDTG
jgi:membrane-anchored protein YejM (alkaline phosphatase superfamily)